ncbi:His-Xaa-Ser repeat protein HxsA2 [Acidihalobacter prosperus]|uniref:His-Xaa-Ser repeat protein HxsA2 n=1 Tax=Acidihalobacter prosperus TaxID=160660 RepID=UPI0038B367E8
MNKKFMTKFAVLSATFAAASQAQAMLTPNNPSDTWPTTVTATLINIPSLKAHRPSAALSDRDFVLKRMGQGGLMVADHWSHASHSSHVSHYSSSSNNGY